MIRKDVSSVEVTLFIHKNFNWLSKLYLSSLLVYLSSNYKTCMPLLVVKLLAYFLWIKVQAVLQLMLYWCHNNICFLDFTSSIHLFDILSLNNVIVSKWTNIIGLHEGLCFFQVRVFWSRKRKYNIFCIIL